MIQRVQSLFLVGVVTCLIATLFFPIWQKIDSATQSGITLDALGTEIYSTDTGHQEDSFPAMIIGILAAAGAAVALLEIFQYKNRLNQIKLGALNSLLMAAVLGFSVYLTFELEKEFPSQNQGEYLMGMYFPAIALILNLLANRFIRRDEALVRSVDRLR